MISPELRILKEELDSSIAAAETLTTSNHFELKIKSLLNVSIYVKATRFLEAATKYSIYSCCTFRGDSVNDLVLLSDRLKSFNNPEFTNIRDLFLQELNYDILFGKTNGSFSQRDISFLNEIVMNRHRNVHAKESSIHWFNSNLKDLMDFNKEYEGLLNIVQFLEKIRWNSVNMQFVV